jgi:putative membrane protein
MNKRRDQIIEILYLNYRTVKDNLYPLLALALGIIGTGQFYNHMLKIGFLLLVLSTIIFSLLKWYCKVFSFGEQRIKIREGVFSKVYKDISLTRVKTIYISDSFIKRLFNISNFHVELIGGKEISFVLSNRYISKIRSTIFKDFILSEEKEPSKNKLSFFKSLLLATTSITLFLTSLSLTLVIINFIIRQYSNWFASAQPIERMTFAEAIYEMQSYPLKEWLQLIPVILVLCALAVLVTGFYVYTKYYGFNIKKKSAYLQVSYGLFNQNTFQIPLREVRSVSIIQPIWFKPFRYVQVKVDYIGMNQVLRRDFFIQPILKENELSAFLENYLPFFKDEKVIDKAKRSVLPDYLLRSVWKFTLVTMILSWWYSGALYLLYLLPIMLASGYLKWQNAGLNFNDKWVIHSSCSAFKIKRMITLKKYIQHTGIKKTVLDRKRNASDYRYSVYSSKLRESYRCRGLTDKKQQNFLKYISEY